MPEVQTAFPLASAGYREPSAERTSYPFQPTSLRMEDGRPVDTVQYTSGGWAWLRNMVNTNGHCGQ